MKRNKNDNLKYLVANANDKTWGLSVTPVFASKSEVLSNIKSGAPEALGSPGKIFIRGSYSDKNDIRLLSTLKVSNKLCAKRSLT